MLAVGRFPAHAINLAQKYVDALCTWKDGRTHFRYREHVKACLRTMLIIDYKAVQERSCCMLPVR